MIRLFLIVLLCLAGACRGGDAAVEPAPPGPPASQTPTPQPAAPAQPPPALTEYLGRPIATTMHWRGADWLLRESREAEEGTRLLLDALAVEPGWTVSDLGAGNGYLSLELARRVGPTGRVLAVDIQPEMLQMLAARAETAGLTNIELIEALPHDPRLPPSSCDLVLMVDVYHELSHPEHTLRAVRRALGPGGRVALVEFRAEDPTVPIKPLHKMSKAQVSRELTTNGFVLDGEFDALPWQHVMFFRPADGPK